MNDRVLETPTEVFQSALPMVVGFIIGALVFGAICYRLESAQPSRIDLSLLTGMMGGLLGLATAMLAVHRPEFLWVVGVVITIFGVKALHRYFEQAPNKNR